MKHELNHHADETPADLAAFVARLDRLAAAERASVSPEFEDRLFVRTRGPFAGVLSPDVARVASELDTLALKDQQDPRAAGIEGRAFDASVPEIRGVELPVALSGLAASLDALGESERAVPGVSFEDRVFGASFASIRAVRRPAARGGVVARIGPMRLVSRAAAVLLVVGGAWWGWGVVQSQRVRPQPVVPMGEITLVSQVNAGLDDLMDLVADAGQGRSSVALLSESDPPAITREQIRAIEDAMLDGDSL